MVVQGYASKIAFLDEAVPVVLSSTVENWPGLVNTP